MANSASRRSAPRLADADEDAGRERDAQFARQLQRLETRLGPLVGRAVMNAARLAQARAEQFQHDALAGRHCPQAGDLGPAHDSGIGVRQQPGLAQRERAHRLEIVDRGFVSERIQSLAGGAIAQLWLVAQCEQRLRAAGGRSSAGDRKHFVGGKIGGPSGARALGEGAIVADIAAKMGERDEHFARIRDVAAMPVVAQTPGSVDQLGKLRLLEPDRKHIVARIVHHKTPCDPFGVSARRAEADGE